MIFSSFCLFTLNGFLSSYWLTLSPMNWYFIVIIIRQTFFWKITNSSVGELLFSFTLKLQDISKSLLLFRSITNFSTDSILWELTLKTSTHFQFYSLKKVSFHAIIRKSLFQKPKHLFWGHKYCILNLLATYKLENQCLYP